MAQADHLPSPILVSNIQGVAKQSTYRLAGADTTKSSGRRHFIGGSDARIIMGEDEAALVRLWREKRGEVEPRTCRAI